MKFICFVDFKDIEFVVLTIEEVKMQKPGSVSYDLSAKLMGISLVIGRMPSCDSGITH